MLKQFAMAVTAAMVLGIVGTAGAADHPVDRLHQHQGAGPGGVGLPGTHHHQNPHEPGGRHGHGRPAA